MWRSLIGLMVLVVGLLGCKPALQPVATPALIEPTASVPLPSTSPAQPLAVPTAAPTPEPSPVAAKSGLRVTATLGPTCPGPQRAGQVCTVPYAGEFIVTRADGSEAAQFTTDVDGRAVVDLLPGDYTISAKVATGRSKVRSSPVMAAVAAGQYVDVQIDLDTGMR